MSSFIDKWNNVRDLTTEEKQAITKQQMRQIISELFDQMKLVYYRGLRLVDANPLGLTRDQVVQGFGNDAMELARLAVLLKDCLNLAAPGTIPDNDDPYA